MKSMNFYPGVLNFSIKILLSVCILFISGCNAEKNNEPVEVKKFSSSESSPSSESNFLSEELSSENEEQSKEDHGSAVSPYNVKDHIGEIVTVKGIVSDVHITEKVAYLNFGKKFPKNDFSGVVFSGKFSDFDDLESFKDKYVEITGSVSVFRNKPQIILNSSDQIKILK